MKVIVLGSSEITNIFEYLDYSKDRGIVLVSVDEPTRTLKEHDIEELARTDFSYHLLPDKIDHYAMFDAASPEQFKYIVPNFDFLLPYPKPIGNPKRQVNFKAFHHFDIDYG